MTDHLHRSANTEGRTAVSHLSRRREPPERYDVVVIGSGLAGLTAAATAWRAGARVALIEGPAPGGRARTEVRDGFHLNLGPHALYHKGEGRPVLDRLGVEVTGADPPKTGKLAWDDHTCPFPQGLGALWSPVLGSTDKVRLVAFLVRLARLDPAEVAHLTIDEWLDASVADGPRPLVRALVRIATYTVDTHLVSADMAAAQLKAALRGVSYLDGGWEQLTKAVAAAGTDVVRLPGTARSVRAVPTGPTDPADSSHPGDSVLVVETGDGSVRGLSVVVANGSPTAAASLLPRGAAPSWSDLGPPVMAGCLDLALRRPPSTLAWAGVDRPHYLVAHAPGAALAPPGMALVHAMRNLPHDDASPPSERRAELRALARRAGVLDDDVVFERYLHQMTVVSASVTPGGGGLAGRPTIDDTGCPGVFVAGDWVGPRGWLADTSLVSGEAAGVAAAAASRRTVDRGQTALAGVSR